MWIDNIFMNQLKTIVYHLIEYICCNNHYSFIGIPNFVHFRHFCIAYSNLAVKLVDLVVKL